ncbi:MAG: tyrosine-type recombinase/integrase [Kiloniellales bacterium]|nr:tyrosine-type recombinase/integrase [Kiloniellales bacterium]
MAKERAESKERIGFTARWLRSEESFTVGEYRDKTTPLRLVVLQTKRVWQVRARVKGHPNPIRCQMGEAFDSNLAAAREWAKEVKTLCDKGINPNERRAETLGAMLDKYIEESTGTLASATISDYRHSATKFPARLRARPVSDVTTAEIRALHNSLRETPAQANRVLAVLSAAFVALSGRSDNPVSDVKRFRETPRKRYLSKAEVTELAKALEQHPNRTAVACIQFQFLTGCRPHEARSAHWDQFDLKDGIWRKLAAYTKQREFHEVPVSAPVRDLLNGLPSRGKSKWLFPAKHDMDEPIGKTGVSKVWRAIREDAGIPDVRLHDLRHSFASFLVASGASLPMIGKMLGHTQAATTARYAHLDVDPLRQYAETAGAAITSSAKANKS